MLNKCFFWSIMAMIMAGFLACSKSDDGIQSSILNNQTNDFDAVPFHVSDFNTDRTPASGTGALGLFELSIDKKSMSAELTPIRKSAITDVLEIVDITNFLKLAPCTDCAKIRSVSLDSNNDLVVSIGIRHPFPAGDPFKPISGRNRADLHVFNVEGTVISNAAGESFSQLGETIANIGLVNADGYSKYLDTVLETIYPTPATIHPYILHFDDYSAGNFDPISPTGFTSVTNPPPSGNLVMAMGCDYNYQDYVFDFDGSFDFIYAIGCTYAVSSTAKSLRFNPEYRVPQHNKKAASEVSVAVISNDLKAGDTSSSAAIEIHVVDISHSVAVGTALNEMLSDSSVTSVAIDVPGITNSPVIIDGGCPASGSGHDPSDPLIYSTLITNEAGAPEGIYTGLVKVTDTYAPGQNVSPLLAGKDGIQRVDPIANPLDGLFDIPEFATYAIFKMNVEFVVTNFPPVAILQPDPASCDMGDTIDFDGTNSYDSDGTITQYEFDFIWDGVEANFTADATNAYGLATSFPYPTDGTFTAGLRVTDNLGAVAYDSVQVNVAHVDVIYVDDSNTSGTEDGSMAHPYNTIMEGVNVGTPGYRIWVDDSGNDYNEYVNLSNKTNVILKSVNWDSSDGGNMASVYRSSGTILNVSNSTDCTVDGFKIYGSSDSGASLSSASDCTIKNCWFTEIGLTGASGITVINVSSSPGAIVEDNEISNCEANVVGGFCSVMMIWDSPMTVQGNEIHNINKFPGSGFILGMYFGNCVPTAGHHVQVRQNKIYDLNMADSGFIIAVYLLQSDDIEIYNNLMYDFVKEDGGANIGIYCNGATNTDIVNNVFYDLECNPFNMAIYMNDYYPNSVTTINNIFQGFYGPPPTVNGWAIYFAPTSVVTADYSDVYAIANTSLPPGTGNIITDAIFVDPANGDFHLDSGSPCIDTGDPSINDPDSSRSDMGCYGGPGGNW